MRGRVLLLSTLVVSIALVGLWAQPGAAVSVPQNVIVNANPVNTTPHVMDGKVEAILPVGGKVFAGGQFTTVQAPTGGVNVTRNNIFAFDAATGAIDTGFVPALDGEVQAIALAPDGNIIVGGFFANVNGAASKGLVKLSPSTGARITEFSAPTNGAVRDLTVRGNKVYVGGSFSRIRSVARQRLAAVDAITGAVDPNLNLPVSGIHNSGTTRVYKLDVSPDGSELVFIGNFSAVNGVTRHQIARINLASTPASLRAWDTDRYAPACASWAFDSYMRDLDFSPDGSYFVVVTTGAYFGGTLCDTAARWETANDGAGQQPTWVDYTGGDTLYSVAATGTVVYVGGHQRWQNNSFAGDSPGPGAVPREGIAALDPVNGLPFSWNPGRARGVGAFALVSTPTGLWVGSDTSRLGGETHRRIGMFPTAGGKTVPPAPASVLPNDLYRAETASSTGAGGNVLYRVNTGGPSLLATDGGPDWAADTGADPSPFRNAGSNEAGWSQVPSVDGTVPPSTPVDVFSSERWDPGDAPEMAWQFPVTAGTQVQVRLYLASRCGCTSTVGSRVFDVAIDGATVLDDYDIVADVGQDRGTMKQFAVTSDGTVDIDFGHVVENPLINAIEIVGPGAGPGPQPGDRLLRRSYDGTNFGPESVASGPPDILWSHARGAFMLNGRVYTGWDDGRLYARTFNGTSFGAATEINTYGLNTFNFPIANLTGMFFWNGRLYYTVAGDGRLFWRWFTPESGIVGADVFQAADSGWANVRGMTLASGNIYYATTSGNLFRVAFVDGGPSGDPTQVGGPAMDGTNWASRALFILNT
jgi:Malectin domain